MSWFFPTQVRQPPPAAGAYREAVEPVLQPGRYLTDGIELYRLLGPVALGPQEMVGLENCRSLEIILITAEQLRGDRLRYVTPSPESGRQTALPASHARDSHHH